MRYAIADLIEDLRRDWQDEDVRRDVTFLGVLLVALATLLLASPVDAWPW